MTDNQYEQFHELRKQYMRDLGRLRAAYLKKFLKVLGIH